MTERREGWAVTIDGEIMSVWLKEKAAQDLAAHYRARNKSGQWGVVPVDIVTHPSAPAETQKG